MQEFHESRLLARLLFLQQNHIDAQSQLVDDCTNVTQQLTTSDSPGQSTPVPLQILFKTVLCERSVLENMLRVNPRSEQHNEHVVVLVKDEQCVVLSNQST